MGYQSFRLWRMVRVANKVENELPEYVELTYGEKPRVDISITANVLIQIKIKVTFRPEFRKEHPELEEAIFQYLKDTYPLIFKAQTKLLVLDTEMTKADILKLYYPKIYAKFGAMIEKKQREKEEQHVAEEPED